jgi:membrane-bound ClpP family serine protease
MTPSPAPPAQRKPFTPTVVIWVGLVVGVIGLIMLLLGIGGAAPLNLKIPFVNIDVSTSTAALSVMIIGFATAVIPLVMAMWVDARRPKERRSQKTYVERVIRGDANPPEHHGGS